MEEFAPVDSAAAIALSTHSSALEDGPALFNFCFGFSKVVRKREERVV